MQSGVAIAAMSVTSFRSMKFAVAFMNNDARGFRPRTPQWPRSCTVMNTVTTPSHWHGSNAGHSSGVAGVDARRATPPDPRLARWGLARCGQLDPSHLALLTREDPRVEPCLIPCTSSLSRSRLPAWPVLRSPLQERPGLPSGSDPEWGPLCMRDMLRNAPFSGFFQILGDQLFDASS